MSGDSRQVAVNTPAWQPGQKGCFHWLDPSHTSPEMPTPHKTTLHPQAAPLQSACSLGLYKRYFLMRTIVGILEMLGDKTLHSMPGTMPLPSQKWGCCKQARLGCEPSAMAFPLFCSLGQVPVLQASVYLLCSPTIPHPMLWYSLLAPRQFFS